MDYVVYWVYIQVTCNYDRKIELKKIDKENWQFVLYETPTKKWICDFVYSPQSFIDLLMLIELTNEEVKAIQNNREKLIELSESIRNNYKNYIERALNRDNFKFNKET